MPPTLCPVTNPNKISTRESTLWEQLTTLGITVCLLIPRMVSFLRYCYPKCNYLVTLLIYRSSLRRWKCLRKFAQDKAIKNLYCRDYKNWKSFTVLWRYAFLFIWWVKSVLFHLHLNLGLFMNNWAERCAYEYLDECLNKLESNMKFSSCTSK